jgi:hypothetical protein
MALKPSMLLPPFCLSAYYHLLINFHSVFILPPRSPIWSSALTSSTIVDSIGYLAPPHSEIPNYKKATRIVLPFTLATTPDTPLNKTAHSWTEIEREKASKAPTPRSIIELEKLVCEYILLHLIIILISRTFSFSLTRHN